MPRGPPSWHGVLLGMALLVAIAAAVLLHRDFGVTSSAPVQMHTLPRSVLATAASGGLAVPGRQGHGRTGEAVRLQSPAAQRILQSGIRDRTTAHHRGHQTPLWGWCSRIAVVLGLFGAWAVFARTRPTALAAVTGHCYSSPGRRDRGIQALSGAAEWGAAPAGPDGHPPGLRSSDLMAAAASLAPTRSSPRRTHARYAVAEGAEFYRLLAAPAACGVGLAWWLALQQDPVRAGDLREQMVEEAKVAREASAAEAARVLELDDEDDIAWDSQNVYDLGEPVRIRAGVPGELVARTVRVRRELKPPSAVLVTELEQPLGIRLEPLAGGRLLRVAEVLPNGTAAAAARVAAVDPRAKAPRVGDVVLAATEPLLVYDKSARLGLKPPQRMVVPVLTAERGAEDVIEGVKLMLKSDGPVTLVLERRP